MRFSAGTATVYLILGVCAVGCGRFWGKSTMPDYRTVVEPPVRDEEMAQRKNEKAIESFERGHPEKAEQLVQEALVADVTYGPAHNTLGKIYFSQGKLYLAAWEFEYAANVMPEEPEPVNNLGLVFETAEKLDLAVQYYDEAHSLAPNVPDYLGNLLRARRKRGDSLRELEPLIRRLVFIETRPEWARWARELLARLPSEPVRESLASGAEDNSESPPSPDSAPEPLPWPVPN